MSDQAPIAMPTLVSLLICDQVIDDKLTNKKSAIGLFNTVLVPRLPTVIQHMAVLASLTEIETRAVLELRLVRDADNQVLFHTHGPVEAPNPLATVDLVFSLHGVRINTPGQYAFEMICARELLGRRRFQVLLRPSHPTGGVHPAGPQET